MKRFIVMILLMLLSSCGVLSPSTKNSLKVTEDDNISSELQIKTESNTISQSTALFALTDSTQNDFQMRYYPNGNLSLTADGHMSGKFDSIIASGKLRKLLQINALKEVNETENKKVDGQIKAHAAHKKVEKQLLKVSKPNGIWIILILVIGVGGLFFVKKHR